MRIKGLNIYKNDNSLFIAKLILFIMWPFGAFVISLFKPNARSSYIIYWLFGMLFCWSMCFYGEGIDFSNIVLRFYMQPDMAFYEFWDRCLNLYAGDSNDKDIYNLFLNWFVHQFSDNFHTLFWVASIPFLYFMLNSLKFVVNDNSRFSTSFYCYVIILLFLLPKDIFDVQNFRFATATWISIYSIIKVYYCGCYRYLIMLLLTPFIHSSFWFFVCVLIIYILLYRMPIRYIYYISLPFAVIATGILSNVDYSILPISLSNWAEDYTSEESQQLYGMNAKGTGFYWVFELFNYLKIVVYAIAIIIIMHSKELEEADCRIKRLFDFQLFFLTIVNFCQAIPVLGSRFLNNSMILTVFLWYKIMYPNKNRMLLLMLFSCIFDILYTKVKHYSMIVDSDFYISNLYYLIVKYWNVNIFEM